MQPLSNFEQPDRGIPGWLRSGFSRSSLHVDPARKEVCDVHVYRAGEVDAGGQEEPVQDSRVSRHKIRKIIEEEGGILQKTYAFMGPWDFLSIVQYPDNETAFRVLAKIGLLEVVVTETFPAEEVEIFTKVFA